MKDMGTVVLGKLESGSICKGQQLVMMPNKVCLTTSSLKYLKLIKQQRSLNWKPAHPVRGFSTQ